MLPKKWIPVKIEPSIPPKNWNQSTSTRPYCLNTYLQPNMCNLHNQILSYLQKNSFFVCIPRKAFCFMFVSSIFGCDYDFGSLSLTKVSKAMSPLHINVWHPREGELVELIGHTHVLPQRIVNQGSSWYPSIFNDIIIPFMNLWRLWRKENIEL